MFLKKVRYLYHFIYVYDYVTILLFMFMQGEPGLEGEAGLAGPDGTKASSFHHMSSLLTATGWQRRTNEFGVLSKRCCDACALMLFLSCSCLGRKG